MAKMDKLKKKMKQRGVTYSELSRKMDTLYRKIAGNGEGFSVREAAYIGRALGLTLDETAEIFFEE